MIWIIFGCHCNSKAILLGVIVCNIGIEEAWLTFEVTTFPKPVERFSILFQRTFTTRIG